MSKNILKINSSISELARLDLEISKFEDIVCSNGRVDIVVGSPLVMRGIWWEKGIISVVQTCFKKGDVLQHHTHTETEILVLYKGSCKLMLKGKKPLICSAPAVRLIPPGTPHMISALEDSYFIACTIPDSKHFPKPRVIPCQPESNMKK